MNDLLGKLSSYNLFNYLFPGIIFVVLAKALLSISFIRTDIILAAFLYYFIGLVISRFGSIVVEPLLRWVKLVEFTPYKDFVDASKSDTKLELLSESNNTYRTLIAMFVLLGLLRAWQWIETLSPSVERWSLPLLFVFLLVTLLFSYRKQTQFVRKRVEACLKGRRT